MSSNAAVSGDAEKKGAKKKKKAKIGVVSAAAAPKKTIAKKKSVKGKTAGSEYKDKSSADCKAAKSSFKSGDDDFADGGSIDSDSGPEDYSDDGEEGEAGYKIGGYHPVALGDKFNNHRYTIVEKLGWGHFSTVWMTHDKLHATRKSPEFVAVKIQKSAPHYRDAAFDEIELLNCVSTAVSSERVRCEFGQSYNPCLVRLLDQFEHTGPHGKHMCMVFEMLGENLLKVIQRYDYRGIPVDIVKGIARQMCVALDFLHRHCSIIHTDLKPENVLIAVAPQPPAPERVAAFLAMNGVVSKKAKKDGSGTKKDSGGDPAWAGGQLDALDPDQRKKLKKKLKKKRQQAKKKEKGKERRRKGGDRGGKADTSTEKRKLMEMQMMERASIPLASLSSNEALAKIELGCSVRAETKGSDVLPSSQSKEDPGSLSGRLEGLELDLHRLEAKYHDDDDDDDELEGSDMGGVLPYQSGLRSTFNEAANVLPPWARPTLFSFFNFRKNDYTEQQLSSRGQGDRKLSYTKHDRLQDTELIAPPEIMYSKLTLIASTSRMMEAFGPPAGPGPGRTDPVDPAFSQWHLALRRGKYSCLSEEAIDFADASLQFNVLGQGYDSEGILGLVGLCLVNALAFQPDRYSIQIAQNDEERPVLWSIVHHASITEHLLGFLELHMEGVRFLAHYKIPPLMCEEDDEELLFVLQRECKHPACRKSGSSDGKCDEEADPEPYSEGQGALLGVDLDILMASMVGETEADESYLSQIYGADGYIRPLDERIRCLVGDRGHMDETIIEYTAMGHALMMAAGELSQDGSQDGGDDYDSVAEDRGKKRPERYDRIDEMYRNVPVKIVDLGNACWTYKHFTADIQTLQYRCPEVLLGAEYGTSADMWSLGCIIFELMTGELLFDPKPGKSWDREEDHLAMMIELLGAFPAKLLSSAKKTSTYFNKRGELIHIQQLKFWGLEEILHDKYKLPEKDAVEAAAFLSTLLYLDPAKRATALECLSSPWLTDSSAAAKSDTASMDVGAEEL